MKMSIMEVGPGISLDKVSEVFAHELGHAIGMSHDILDNDSFRRASMR